VAVPRLLLVVYAQVQQQVMAAGQYAYLLASRGSLV
jgi:hypothetical protein